MAGKSTTKSQRGLLAAIVLPLLIAACTSTVIDPIVAVCEEVFAIDGEVLAEQLTRDQISTRLDRLESELLPEARGEVEDATDRFLWAARQVVAASAYDYPTFQALNYLDTYEQMGLHVDAFEAVQGVRRACEQADMVWVGDAPVITEHVSQRGIEFGKYTVEELIQFGDALFTASFNSLGGAGRPRRTGTGELRPRRDFPDNFNRISGPDSNACSACHSLPGVGGGGDNAANVFALGQQFDFVDFDNQRADDGQALNMRNVANERNTPGMFGSGLIELLAREMTADLQSIRDAALESARSSGQPVSADLATKGVDFGSVTAHPTGFIDTSKVAGVDSDLVIRPFSQKGVVTSLREFTNNALNQHFGLQNYERAGAGRDVDGDGVANEITPGDATALVVFQATLPAPVQRVPTGEVARQTVTTGRDLFNTIGCAVCHVAELPLDSLVFTVPGPYNRGRDLVPGDVESVLRIDLAEFSARFSRNSAGQFMIPVFTDLKRHEMGPVLDNELLEQADVPTDEWLTRKLWGFASEPPFLHHGRATLVSEAIDAHGGEAGPSAEAFLGLSPQDQSAIIEFLMTLQIDPAR